MYSLKACMCVCVCASVSSSVRQPSPGPSSIIPFNAFSLSLILLITLSLYFHSRRPKNTTENRVHYTPSLFILYTHYKTSSSAAAAAYHRQYIHLFPWQHSFSGFYFKLHPAFLCHSVLLYNICSSQRD